MAECEMILLQVWRKDRQGNESLYGYVGESRLGRKWPLTKRKKDAAPYPNAVLAEGAANQYLGYIRTSRPGLYRGMYIKYVRYAPVRKKAA